MPVPLVSFCIPTYGRARFVGQTITSALAQTVGDIEVVVVDDLSPDDTADVVSSIKDPRVRYVRNPQNLGVPSNLNRAFELARGEFLILLEDHDLLDPRYLENTLELMRRHPNVGFVATGLHTIDEEGRLLREYVVPLPEEVPGRQLLRLLLTRTTCPFSVTVLIRRKALTGISTPFDPKYWWYADQNLWMTLASQTDFGYVQLPLLKMRTREIGHSLTGKEWESLLSVDRVHQDNWHLLYPRRSVAAAYDAAMYQCAKLRRVAEYRIIRSLHGAGSWGVEDRRNTAAYLTPAGHAALMLLGIAPAAFWQMLHRIVRRRMAA